MARLFPVCQSLLILTTSRAFLSGPGVPSQCGRIAVDDTDPSPRYLMARKIRYKCYMEGTEDCPGPVIPLHEDCFMILSIVLRGLGARNVDIEVLYHTMVGLVRKDRTALDLDYGADVRRAQKNVWECMPGIEYCVVQPSMAPWLANFIQFQATYNNFDLPFPNPNRRPRVLRDPFSMIPVEIMHSICSYLPGESLKALLRASFEVSVATHHNSFWKLFLKWDMPWFWEVHRLVASHKLPPYLNYKGFYLWLDEITAPRYGKADRFLGVANRRRIWGISEQLIGKYDRALSQSSSKGTSQDTEGAGLDVYSWTHTSAE
ncbi:hypothetical protein BDV28DRAFT_112610 [Aspergillus coremiiformis]|uniref:F-box domain-containing protein n=1 Tax=Aspergillus coremiiformis TaxID=138285 RepID=A0A5N6Z6X1_9EURO|nr:hypothetical protein BDV28DRAFT_112610 [Aspergillus coremiiformis]